MSVKENKKGLELMVGVVYCQELAVVMYYERPAGGTFANLSKLVISP